MGACDAVGDVGERAEALAVEDEACLDDLDCMGSASPFPNQSRAWLQPWTRRERVIVRAVGEIAASLFSSSS